MKLIDNVAKQNLFSKIKNFDINFTKHALLRLEQSSRVYTKEDVSSLFKAISKYKIELFLEKENVYHIIFIFSKRKAIDVVFKVNGLILILTVFPLGRKSLLKICKKMGLDYDKI